MTRVVFHPEAVAEAAESRRWYEEKERRLGAAFMIEIDNAVSLIGESPETWPKSAGNTRRIPLRRFPYYLVYRIQQNAVEIIAVAHQRRRPGYWRGR